MAEAIEAEKVKLSISNDEYSIQHYFEMYANADFDDDETRDTIFEYFIDKIYVYDDRLVITWYYSDNKSEVALDELTDITNAESISNEKGSTLTQSAPRTIFSHKLYYNERDRLMLNEIYSFMRQPFYVHKNSHTYLYIVT